jgi:hypothetical protein
MFSDVKNPRWDGKNHERIIFDVLFEGREGWLSFVAAHDDCTTHGPMLYNFAVQGLFGPVADSDEERILRGELPPPEGYRVVGGGLVNIAAVTAEAEAELSRRLASLSTEEAKARAEIDEAYAAERKAKLAALLAVKEQAGWPLSVQWPE